RLYSAAYLALPVTFTRPSTREVGTPIYVVGLLAVVVMRLRLAMAPSRDALVGLRLRGAARRLAERARDRAAPQADPEVVGAEAACALQQHVGGAGEIVLGRPLAPERGLGLAVAPRLVGDAAERDPRLRDVAVLEVERRRDRDQRERERQPVADLQICV